VRQCTWWNVTKCQCGKGRAEREQARKRRAKDETQYDCAVKHSQAAHLGVGGAHRFLQRLRHCGKSEGGGGGGARVRRRTIKYTGGSSLDVVVVGYVGLEQLEICAGGFQLAGGRRENVREIVTIQDKAKGERNCNNTGQGKR
jgi:hypothetical protein